MNPRRRRCGLTRGLTLLELALTMAVLAILGTLAAPPLADRLARDRLAGAAETLAADLAEARFQAARSGRSLHLTTRDGPTWCWSVSAERGCDCAGPQPCQLRRVLSSSHGGVTLIEARAVAVAPDGTAQAMQVALLESSRGERLVVNIGALGRTHICASAGRWPQYTPC